jgi:hypothetical protein
MDRLLNSLPYDFSGDTLSPIITISNVDHEKPDIDILRHRHFVDKESFIELEEISWDEMKSAMSILTHLRSQADRILVGLPITSVTRDCYIFLSDQNASYGYTWHQDTPNGDNSLDNSNSRCLNFVAASFIPPLFIPESLTMQKRQAVNRMVSSHDMYPVETRKFQEQNIPVQQGALSCVNVFSGHTWHRGRTRDECREMIPKGQKRIMIGLSVEYKVK